MIETDAEAAAFGLRLSAIAAEVADLRVARQSAQDRHDDLWVAEKPQEAAKAKREAEAATEKIAALEREKGARTRALDAWKQAARDRAIAANEATQRALLARAGELVPRFRRQLAEAIQTAKDLDALGAETGAAIAEAKRLALAAGMADLDALVIVARPPRPIGLNYGDELLWRHSELRLRAWAGERVTYPRHPHFDLNLATLPPPPRLVVPDAAEAATG